MRHALVCSLLLVAFLTTGCDYGLAEGEDPQFDLEMEEQEYDYAEMEGELLGPNGEPLPVHMLKPFHKMVPFKPAPMLEWHKNVDDEGDDNPNNDFCDCAGVCQACMDAYICGHEAAILEYCDDCAQCQKECSPDEGE